MNHEILGDEVNTGGYEHERWTVKIEHYDHEQEEVGFTGLASLIRKRSEGLTTEEELIEEIDEEIERLQNYSIRDHLPI